MNDSNDSDDSNVAAGFSPASLFLLAVLFPEKANRFQPTSGIQAGQWNFAPSTLASYPLRPYARHLRLYSGGLQTVFSL